MDSSRWCWRWTPVGGVGDGLQHTYTFMCELDISVMKLDHVYVFVRSQNFVSELHSEYPGASWLLQTAVITHRCCLMVHITDQVI